MMGTTQLHTSPYNKSEINEGDFQTANYLGLVIISDKPMTFGDSSSCTRKLSDTSCKWKLGYYLPSLHLFPFWKQSTVKGHINIYIEHLCKPKSFEDESRSNVWFFNGGLQQSVKGKSSINFGYVNRSCWNCILCLFRQMCASTSALEDVTTCQGGCSWAQ